MKLFSFLALVCLLFTGCPKKNSDSGETSAEPVEGASTAPNEKAGDTGGGQEMQEKKDANAEAPPPADPVAVPAPAEEKK